MRIEIIDVAAECREMYGDRADEVAGRKLPEHEYRFQVHFDSGARTTFHYGATADHIMDHMKYHK